MLRAFILKHEKGVQRTLEILPGFVSWNLILFPYWGILVIPMVVAYFVLLFDVYWFFQSLTIAITASISHLRIEAAKKYNWLKDIKTFPDWQKVEHIIIIPSYKEPLDILNRTLSSLANQDFPLKKLHIVLGMEAKEDEQSRKQK